ncbi:hypothetical protein HDU82_005093 [Entophlyctis luteolus]|nr:hypothetical protein HDU82_005093 [Entophlyctis luteolus]
MALGGRTSTSAPAKEAARFQRRQDASFLNRWTYSYVNETIRRGFIQDLGDGDWALNNDDEDAELLSTRLMDAWNTEVAKLGPEKASLAWVTLKLFKNAVFIMAFFFLMEEAVLLVSASFLSKLLVWFSDRGAILSQGFAYAAVLSICACAVAVLHHVSWWFSNRLGTHLRIAFVTAIYKKCMKLSISHTASSGYIVNLVANDINRFDEAANFFLFIAIGPLLLVVVTALVYLQIGNAAFVASAVTLLIIPVQAWISGQFGKLRRATVEPRDVRLKHVSDMLSGIMMVKLYAWEKPLMEKIGDLRKQEIDMMWKANILRAINLAIYQAFSTIIEFFSFGTFYLIGGVFTPSIVFTTITLLTSLKWNMGFRFPTGLQFTIESLVSFRRIQQFLLLPEIDAVSVRGQSPSDPKIVFDFNNASFFWPVSPLGQTSASESKFVVSDVPSDEISHDTPQMKAILSSITLSGKEGQLIVIVGPVGSGKSSLLNAILREMECSQTGSLYVRPNLKIAYASQTPWILSGTVAENILFGSAHDQQRLADVIRACALQRDIDLFEHGIHTVVGERGITLSGGQKARIALARACYAASDLVLLDDPLSAVDAAVGRELFDNCVNGLLREKTRILVTHQLQYVRDADVVVLLENGQITAQGSYDHVMNSASTFSDIMRKFSQDEDVTTEEDQGKKVSLGKQLLVEDDADQVDSGAPTGFAKEAAAKGSVSMSVYHEYFKSGSSWLQISILVTALVLGQVLLILCDYSIGQWSSQNSQDQKKPLWGSLFVTLAIVGVTVVILRSLMFFGMCIKSSLALSNKMTMSVFNTEMRFFVENSAGRIMNRMSSDLNRVDEQLPWTMFDFVVAFLLASGTVVLCASILPLVLVVMPPIGYLFYHIRRKYVASSRQVRRHEAITRSPVYASVPATLEGLSIVRAFGAQQRFVDEFSGLQNENSRLAILYLSIGRWLGMRLDIISACFLTVVVFTTVAVSRSQSLQVNGANVGLILTYSMNLVGSLQWAFRQSAEVENLMTSAERVLEYTRIPPEKETVAPVSLPQGWPKSGEVMFENVSLKYPPSEKNVLNNISVRFPAGSTIGIVGRTGAGKSSLLQALFRLVRPEGRILIDGVDTASLALSSLRSSISIIPQDPFCFSGTIRFNLDPTGAHADTELWAALAAVQLHTTVADMPGKLDARVAENGANLSLGERQLVCLARAILRAGRLVVMDEATSAVDLNTDALIAKVLRDPGGVFHRATTLTIAHRLDTIIDYDFVLVLDRGAVVEFGPPFELLQKAADNPSAFFARLVRETGDESSLRLHASAKDAYEKQKPGWSGKI